uniref:Beta-hexosaminidase n=1 Tax=Neogobius melanostomus TaxID=47308 RepID=A0A8C6SJI2_9GOBI
VNFKIKILLLLLLVSFDIQTVRGLWPLPQSISRTPERFSLQPDAFYFTYGQLSAAQYGCSVLDEAFKRYFPLIFPDYFHKRKLMKLEGRRFLITFSYSSIKYVTHYFYVSDNLSVSGSRATLNAESVWGALRGNNQIYYVNKTDIQDFPRFPFRGILLDTSRHYLPLQSIFKTLDGMAYSKFNVFHWHIVDDPSFPYQSRTFQTCLGAYHPMTHVYTQDDVQKVISYARLRGIRVLPEFDSPGHTASWGKGTVNLSLSVDPCYRGGSPSGTFGPVNPSLSSTYDFMSKMLKEVSQVFPDSYIHLGGDEVNFSCWYSNPDVRAFMEKMGFGSDFTKLEAFYMEMIMNITTALNRTAIVWQDVFDYHEKIPQGTVLHIWKGVPFSYQKELAQITKAGKKVILAAPWYINHISYGQDWRNYYTVQPLNFTGTEEQKKLVIGVSAEQVVIIGQLTNCCLLLRPRGCAAAERLWSDEKQTTSVAKAYPRLNAFRCMLLRCILYIYVHVSL